MTPNESMIKVTEQSNEISNNIDKCSAKEIVNKLQRCDDEMFEYKVKTYKVWLLTCFIEGNILKWCYFLWNSK